MVVFVLFKCSFYFFALPAYPPNFFSFHPLPFPHISRVSASTGYHTTRPQHIVFTENDNLHNLISEIKT